MMSDELQVSLRDKFYMPPEAASERALHGVSQSPRIVSFLRLLSACTSAPLKLLAPSSLLPAYSRSSNEAKKKI